MKKNIIKKALDYYFHPDHVFMFSHEVMRAAKEFGGETDIFSIDDPEIGVHFSEWFLFDYKLQSGETPLEYFYNKNPLKLSDDDKSIYKSIQDNIYDIFEVIKVEYNKGLVMEQIRTGKKYKVLEKLATRGLQKRDIMICRLIKVIDHYEIAGGSDLVLPPLGDKAKEFFSKIPDKLDPKIVFDVILSKNRASIQELGEGEIMVSGGFGGASHEGYDDCPVCQLLKKCEKEGRQPSREEIMKAMAEANEEKNKK